MRLAVDILAGLAYAAERGMTHRDLKMSNVLVTSRAAGQAGGFWPGGHAAGAIPRTKKGAIRGRSTMRGWSGPPACATTIRAATSFSSGVILYNMLTGASPIWPKRATA